mmetsp:Transcript_8237/g.16496  ORF Transcript_8237/g.16496 Transcript_8237/m.16496 type:complete len:152 (-) Transcript_8237:57-512(-)|eukprot:CAMPEP_0182461804 /NCGR_PEP_ID=MMETSP1319-20130603/6276_1 /TAXON_ID=172717 /ORGANISM="Bolidomonas pacifica, Strain RCC208" /LENGTH=151 /DNA_ID=CAMNT_0024661143 /DNA_START=56 /DNA_END=511 /DNA_ORIENTATION=-
MFLHSRLLILLLSAIFAAGFSPPSLLSEKRASSVSRLYQYAEPAGRRDVLKVCVASAPAFVAASSLYPAAARAESAEEAVARIAARSEAENALAREKEAALKAKNTGKSDDGASGLVLGVLGGGVALSLPFFLPNLIRLGKKLGGGGNPGM